jgi:hypothetical protein
MLDTEVHENRRVVETPKTRLLRKERPKTYVKSDIVSGWARLYEGHL